MNVWKGYPVERLSSGYYSLRNGNGTIKWALFYGRPTASCIEKMVRTSTDSVCNAKRAVRPSVRLCIQPTYHMASFRAEERERAVRITKFVVAKVPEHISYYSKLLLKREKHELMNQVQNYRLIFRPKKTVQLEAATEGTSDHHHITLFFWCAHCLLMRMFGALLDVRQGPALKPLTLRTA